MTDPIILTLEQAVTARIHECADTTGITFGPAIRPIYGSSNGLRPVLIGSCILLSIKGVRFIATAAHVVDWIATTKL